MDDLTAFATWADEFDIADAPDDVVQRATLQIASVLAAAHAGTTEEWVTDLASDANGDATAIGGQSVDPYTAAFTNASASIIHDYDDYLFMGHTGHSSVCASLAACERKGLDGAALVENVIIANELEGRLGGAVAVGPHNGQMWAFIHQAGAAAVAANAASSGGATEIRNAVGMALYNPDFPYDAGFIDSDAKTFTAASPTAAGLRVGDAALVGASAAEEALPNFLHSYAYLPMPEVFDGWGESWVTRSTCYKPRPGCAYVQSPLECLETVVDQGVDPDDIDHITVKAPILSFGMEGLSRPYRQTHLLPVNVNFSVQYTLALYLQAGAVTPELLDESYLAEHRQALDVRAGSIDVEHDWGLTADVLEGLGQGVDYSPLLGDRGLIESLRGFKRLGDAHDSVDTVGEAKQLLTSGKIPRVLNALRSPRGWDEFDMANARFDELEFAFGAVLAVEAGGETHHVSTTEHAGSCGRPLEAVTETVQAKFERETGADFDIVRDAHERELDELTGLM